MPVLRTIRSASAILFALIRDLLLAVPTAWLLIKGQRRWIADFRRIWYTVRK